MAGNDDPWSVGGVTRAPGSAAPVGAVAPEGTDAIDGAAAAGATAGVDPTQATTEVSSLDAVSEAIASGAMDVEAATRELVAQSVASLLGPGADPAAVAAIRAEVEAMLADDPTLAHLLRGS